MANVSCDILETVIVFPADGSKYHKELNLVKWGSNAPKYDLRGWTDDRQEMTKGVTLTKDELLLLKEKLGGIEL